MKSMECKGCGKVTLHGRQFGIGTLIGVLVTGGLWLIAMPFYPVRCKICGAAAD